ncbi:hypothetical protein RRG08_026574 [Elysia crispata]|uniref:Uncharacterized protein n=1 Tax=Elysia crispata TaxID=231223 RepID=A0AAE1CSB9_9GAST|nr:hypothetical protein RRG08_026574 [Elysia crispata]
MNSSADEKFWDEEEKCRNIPLVPEYQDKNEEFFTDSDYYKRNLLPVDRGWAWVISFAGFLISFHLGLSSQTMAILFLEVIELFETKITTASLIFRLGAGMVIVPGISLIRYYFHRRRSLAQIIGRCGISVCGIVMPTLIRLIRKEFGVRGTFLVVAAIELHIVLAGLLLRPVESYNLRPDMTYVRTTRRSIASVALTDESALALGIGG